MAGYWLGHPDPQIMCYLARLDGFLPVLGQIPDLVAKTRFLTHYAGHNKYLPIILLFAFAKRN